MIGYQRYGSLLWRGRWRTGFFGRGAAMAKQLAKGYLQPGWLDKRREWR